MRDVSILEIYFPASISSSANIFVLNIKYLNCIMRIHLIQSVIVFSSRKVGEAITLFLQRRIWVYLAYRLIFSTTSSDNTIAVLSGFSCN